MGVMLAHAGNQEDLIVHGQTERHADEEDWHEADQRTRSANHAPEAVLEKCHCDTECGCDREQEAHTRSQRHHQGTENHQQQDHCQTHDNAQVERHCALEAVSDVNFNRNQTSDTGE